MENNNLMLRISRLLSSSLGSCRFRAVPDVADSSISMQIQTHNHNNIMIPFENDTSPFININPEKTLANHGFSGPNPCKKKNDAANRSSSSHSGWFSSADDKFPENEAFFTFSSCSGDSFRLRDLRRPKLIRSDHEIMKSIDERKKMTTMAGSSRRMAEPPATPQITSNDMTKTHEKKKKNGEVVAGSESDDELIMSAKIYYDSSRSCRRSRRRSRRILGEYSCVAVEKKSRDPRRDFEASMVEMMMAKEVLRAEDLETLLISFLSLNSVCYHSLIFQVFSDICQSFLTF